MARYMRTRNRSNFAESRDRAAGWTRSGESEAHRRHKPDYLIPVLALFLIVVGLIVVYAISPGIAAARGVSEQSVTNRQLLSAGLGIFAFFAVSKLPLSWWPKLEKPLLVAAGVTAIIVKLFGETVNGAQRWVQIGGLSFQAAELIKLALLVWLAGFLSARAMSYELSDVQKTLKPLGIALAIIAVVVAGIESDLGSAGVMVAMIGACVFMVGMPLRKIGIIGLAVGIFLTLAIASSGYRRQRIATFLNPTQDCQNAGYQICESLKAIGSGGVFGKGLGKSVQAYGYLPEASNDSIFAIFAEKFGFFGVSVLIGVFGLLFARLKRIIERTQDLYQRLLVTGVLAWLSAQTLINIGAMIGLMPLKGITLPFISTGGTSLVFVSIALGIVFQISRNTAYRVVEDKQQETEPISRGHTMLRRS
ncbi:MAG: putative lipid II flippase FtsW [bacterium]|nr:putative lipid II flippase FtsW [bacterium]